MEFGLDSDPSEYIMCPDNQSGDRRLVISDGSIRKSYAGSGLAVRQADPWGRLTGEFDLPEPVQIAVQVLGRDDAKRSPEALELAVTAFGGLDVVGARRASRLTD